MQIKFSWICFCSIRNFYHVGFFWNKSYLFCIHIDLVVFHCICLSIANILGHCQLDPNLYRSISIYFICSLIVDFILGLCASHTKLLSAHQTSFLLNAKIIKINSLKKLSDPPPLWTKKLYDPPLSRQNNLSDPPPVLLTHPLW